MARVANAVKGKVPWQSLPPSRQRLLLCVAAALAVHAALLGQLRTGGLQFAAPSAMTVRIVRLQRLVDSLQTPEPALHEVMPDLAALPQLKLPDTADLAMLDSGPEGADSDDAQAPQLSYPDAPLPAGEGQATVLLSLDGEGHVTALKTASQTLPQAFEFAIESAFAGSHLSLAQRGGLRTAGTLCVLVRFKEGEAPSWQRIAPAGVCKRGKR